MFKHGQKPYIIAEIGANHNGDIELARRMIDIAREAGCNAVKFQSWDEGLFSKTVYDENKFIGDDYRDRSDYTLRSIMTEFKVTREDLRDLANYCTDIGIDFSTTPFAPSQVDDLAEFGAPFVKIASMDLVSDYMLRKAADSGLPVVLSTGFGTMSEIDHAVRTLENANCQELVILHCLGLYPPPDDVVNLANLEMLRTTFGYPVGFSDHTLGIDIPLAAMALGAVVIEKHFTLDKEMFGWDHKMSADPDEIIAICAGRDRIHAAVGSARRVLSSAEIERSTEYRRSIVAARPIAAGTEISANDIAYKRPGRGLSPNHDTLIVGRTAARDIQIDELIRFEDLGRGEL
ncbi:MAG: N-acetylneuraminate synthase family protein [Pseudomonadota bacterium]